MVHAPNGAHGPSPQQQPARNMRSARAAQPEEEMKFVIAIVKPNRVDEVRGALSALGVKGMTVSEVKGYGRQRGHTEIYRGAEYQIDFVPKAKIEVMAEDDDVQAIVDTILKAARTGEMGPDAV